MHYFLNELLQRRNPTHFTNEENRFSPIRTILGTILSPSSPYKTIHIAGSKGKGSTAHYINAVLQKKNFSTLLFTSPHLLTIRERFILNNQMITQDTLRMALMWLEQREEESGVQLPFFDAMTAILFFLADQHEIDYLIIETGLGGRLDATNICHSDLTIITSIELEHTKILGDTIQAIAQEKAGIMKPKRPVFLASQLHEGMDTLVQYAQKLQVPLFIFNELFTITKNALIVDNSYHFIYKDDLYSCTMPTPVKALADNALLALAVLDYLLPNQKIHHTWLQTIPTTSITGRYQAIRNTIILDVSHTNESFLACATTFIQQFYDKKRTLIFGCAEDKDFNGMASHFINFHEVYLVSPRGINENMKEYACITQLPYLASLTDFLTHYTQNENEVILIAGSFYIISEALEFFTAHP